MQLLFNLAIFAVVVFWLWKGIKHSERMAAAREKMPPPPDPEVVTLRVKIPFFGDENKALQEALAPYVAKGYQVMTLNRGLNAANNVVLQKIKPTQKS